MTYKDIINQIKNISLKCDNVGDNYKKISELCKPDYSDTFNYDRYPYSSTPYKRYYTVNIITPIYQIDKTTVQNNINNYVNKYLGISDTSKTINTKLQLISFLNDMINFCSNNLYFIKSRYLEDTTYLIYRNNNNYQNINIGNVYNIDNIIIRNEDVNTILISLFNNIRNNIKTQVIKYNYITC